MTENIKETENSTFSLSDNKSNNLLPETQGQIKIKKKLYYLYKNGTKYIVKKKDKDKNSVVKETKSNNIKGLENFEKIIYGKFKSKYSKMSTQYNTFITAKLMHNVSSHIVAVFKEFLIYGDIFEFLTKNYSKRNSIYLLKQLINFYITNNVIYPNYTVLPEGNYIFKNIQQKQRIIDNQEANEKNKKTQKEEKNKKNEKILNSKIIESILNQTDTSEARNCFDLNNNSINDNQDNNEINLLIQNIDKAEEQINKNKIFQKKKLIRIVSNNNDLNSNNFFRLCQYINKKDNILNINNSNEQNNKNSEQNNNSANNKNLSSNKSTIRELISSIFNYHKKKKNVIYSTSTEKSNNNFLNMHKKMNTLEINTMNSHNEYLLTEAKENNSSKNSNFSLLHSTSPYVIKRPKKQSISYNKKNIYYSNSSNKYYLKKSLKSINKPDYLDYSPFKSNYQSENKSQIYAKKFNKLRQINTDLNINSNSNINKKKINFNNNVKNNKKVYPNLIINKKYYNINTINYNTDEPRIYKKIQNNSLNINKNKKKIEKYSNHTFKSITKMLKNKYIIDKDLIYNKINYNTFNEQKNIIISTPLISKNKFEKNKDIFENFTNSKNIYISNNITNNNYYTIDNNQEKNSNLLLKKYLTKYELNRDKANKEYEIENAKDKKGNILLNSESNISSINNNEKSNTIKNNDDISRKYLKTSVISPYKNRLIGNTALKSLDKYSLKYLLKKFSYSNDKAEKKNNLYIDNNKLELNNNKLKTINIEKDKNNIRLKRKYLIIKDNNLRGIKKINNKLRDNLINGKNPLYKTTGFFNKNKTSSLSTKNSNRKSNIIFN